MLHAVRVLKSCCLCLTLHKSSLLGLSILLLSHKGYCRKMGDAAPHSIAFLQIVFSPIVILPFVRQVLETFCLYQEGSGLQQKFENSKGAAPEKQTSPAAQQKTQRNTMSGQKLSSSQAEKGIDSSLH